MEKKIKKIKDPNDDNELDNTNQVNGLIDTCVVIVRQIG